MALPSLAAAELASPLGGLAGSPEEQQELSSSTSTTTSAVASNSSATISTGTLVMAGIAVAVLLGGIAFLIVRDARSVAPVSEGPSGGMSASDRAARLRRRRAKAKAAKQQRKRNR